MSHCDDGDAQGAIRSLGDLWPEPSDEIRGEARAEALLAVGVIEILKAFAGHGTHEGAKDHLSESVRLFGDSPRADLANIWLANAYLRQGSANEAFPILQKVTEDTAKPEYMVLASISIAFGLTEAQRYHEALHTLMSVEPMVKDLGTVVQGKYHNQRGVIFRKLGKAMESLAEYRTALYWFEVSGNLRCEVLVHNNLANVHADREEFEQAHTHAQAAITLASSLKEGGRLSGAKDTLADIFLRQGKLPEALVLANDAVRLLIGDDKVWLPGALITRGKILARQKSDKAKADFIRAIKEAELTGNLREAGRAYLTMIEELNLPVKERAEYYRRADSLPVDPSRLRLCASKIIAGIHPPRQRADMQTEIERIAQELRSHQGNVDKAATHLGLSGPGLARIIDRSPELIKLRQPKRVRRTSIIKK